MISWSSMAMARSLFRKLVTHFIAWDATQMPRLQTAVSLFVPEPWLQTPGGSHTRSLQYPAWQWPTAGMQAIPYASQHMKITLFVSHKSGQPGIGCTDTNRVKAD